LTIAPSEKLRQPLLVCALLVLATLAVYWPVLAFDFLNYDDPIYTAGNPHVVQGITGTSLLWGLTNVEAEFWQPLTWWSHMLDCEIYGTRAGAHHVTNLLLHLANTLLLFAALRKMSGACWRSGFVAALFAIHPLHVESVAWISERKDVLSTLFVMLALLAYGYYAKGGTRGENNEQATRNGLGPAAYYGLSVLAFALSLAAKPTLVTLPFLLVLLDYWPLKRISFEAGTAFAETTTRLLLEKLPFLALTIASASSSYWIQASRHNLGDVAQYPWSLRLANVAVSYFRYVRRMFWPSDLAVFYPYPDDWPAAYVAVAGAVLALITVLAVVSLRRLPYFAVGWFWFLGTLVPMIGLVQVGHHAMADRYTYFPMIGCFIVLVWGAAEVAAKLAPDLRLSAIAGAACVLLSAGVAARQVNYWRNSETLFRHALDVTDGNYVAHDNLGAALDQQGKYDEALDHFQEAFKIECARKTNPDLSSIRFDLGSALVRKEKYDEAKVHLAKAIEIQPNIARFHHNLACVLALQGQLDGAIAQFQETLRIDPHYPRSRELLTALLAQREQSQGQKPKSN
jgi:tetratricopeptide (TPR) repeat protein